MSYEEQTRISILLADDHRLLVDAIAPVLARESDFHLRTAGTLAETLAALRDAPSDVVLLDVKMPGMTGLASVKQVVEMAGDGRVALFSGNIDENFARIALNEGVGGFIPKTTPLHVLPSIIRLVATGSKYMPFMTRDDSAGKPDTGQWGLTDREFEIMQLVKSGLTNKEIARQISTSEVRVKMHLRAIFAKLGARNRAHAADIISDRSTV